MRQFFIKINILIFHKALNAMKHSVNFFNSQIFCSFINTGKT